METRFTGIAHDALFGYQPVSLVAGHDDYTVIPATASTIMIGIADVPAEAGARVPIKTTFMRTNCYAGGPIAYADPLTVTAGGLYIKLTDTATEELVGYALSTVTTSGDLFDALLFPGIGKGTKGDTGAAGADGAQIATKDVTVAAEAASGASAADATLVGGTVIGVVSKTDSSKVVKSVAIAGDGAITVTLASATAAGTPEVYTVAVLKA